MNSDGYVLKRDFKKYFNHEEDYYAWLLEHYYDLKLNKVERIYAKFILQIFSKLGTKRIR